MKGISRKDRFFWKFQRKESNAGAEQVRFRVLQPPSRERWWRLWQSSMRRRVPPLPVHVENAVEKVHVPQLSCSPCVHALFARLLDTQTHTYTHTHTYINTYAIMVRFVFCYSHIHIGSQAHFEATKTGATFEGRFSLPLLYDMTGKASNVEAELAALKVPTHPLPGAASSSATTATFADNTAATPNAKKKLRDRIKPVPVAGSKPEYYCVLEDIERRRTRDLRRIARTAEAETRRKSYRILALVLVLLLASALGFYVFARFV